MTKKISHHRPPALLKKPARLKPQPILTTAQALAQARTYRDQVAARIHPNRKHKLSLESYNELVDELIELESIIIDLMTDHNLKTRKVVYKK